MAGKLGRPMALAAVAAAAIAASGCGTLVLGPTFGAQQGPLAGVDVTTQLCAKLSPPPVPATPRAIARAAAVPGAAPYLHAVARALRAHGRRRLAARLEAAARHGRRARAHAADSSYSTCHPDPIALQALVAYLVPDGAPDPTVSASSTDPSTPALTLSPAPGYASWLNGTSDTDPAPAGYHWVAFVSNQLDFTSGGASFAPWTLTAHYELPRGADGSPFVSPLPVRVDVGEARYATPTSTPLSGGDDVSAYCDSPGALVDVYSTDQVSSCVPDRSETVHVDTTDLGVLTPAAPAVPPGSTATLHFPLRFSGLPASGTTFALQAGSNLPGATVAAADPSWTPQAGDAPPGGGPFLVHDEPVTVAVPAGATPGTYSVTLAAGIAGRVRQAVGSLVVRPGPPGPATVDVVQGSSRRWPRLVGWSLLTGAGPRGGYVDLGSVRCLKQRGRICWAIVADLLAGRAQLAGGATPSRSRLVSIGHLRMAVRGGHARALRIRLSPRALRRLASGRPLLAVLVVRDYPGLAPTRVRTVVLGGTR